MAGRHEKAAKSRAKAVPVPGAKRKVAVSYLGEKVAKKRKKDGTPLKVLDESHILKVPMGSQRAVREAEKRAKELKETPAAVIASSPAFAAPYGKGETVTMPFPLADEALADFRRLYPGLSATWANVSAAECDRLRARVDELLRVNNDLIERERRARADRDEAVLAMQIIGSALLKKVGPLDSAKVQALLNSARNLILGKE